ANGACSIGGNLTATTAGIKSNTTGPISSTESGAGSTSNTATLAVLLPPGLAKAFGAGSIPLAGSTTLTFTLDNPNTTVNMSSIGFADTLPSGLVVASPNGVTGSCGTAGGAVLTPGTITAVTGTP